MSNALFDAEKPHYFHLIARYSTAFATTALAMWARYLLHPFLGDSCHFSLFYLSVLLTALIAGTGPARFSIFLGTLAALQFITKYSSNITEDGFGDLLQLMIYVFVTIIATSLYDRVERGRLDAERRSLENEQLMQSLREADARKDEFLALLAHELRNPLAPICSSTELLKHDSDCHLILRIKETIGRHAGHLVRLTNDLLDVSRFCKGRVDLEIGDFDLHDAVKMAVEMNQELFDQKQHQFRKLIPTEPIILRGDLVRVTQLIGNLLSNAGKYTPQSGRISLQVEVHEAMAQITIADNGIGFPEAEAQRILEPFVQVNLRRTRDYGGLGLGLAIVERLVALHQGKLHVSSDGPGCGSKFQVDLPLSLTTLNTQVEPQQTFSHEKLVDDNLGAIENREQKILLVDDNTDAAEMLGDLLRDYQYNVTLAHDGMSALQLVDSNIFDFVILDIGMPGMDGYEVARRLRKSNRYPYLKLIALTGWGSQSDKQLAMKSGFDRHLVKPISLTALRETLEELLPNVSQKLEPQSQSGPLYYVQHEQRTF